MLSHDLDQVLKIFGPSKIIERCWGQERSTRCACESLHYGNGLVVQVEGGWFASDAVFFASFEIEANGARYRFMKESFAAEIEVESNRRIPQHDPYFDEIAYFIGLLPTHVPELCLPKESAEALFG